MYKQDYIMEMINSFVRFLAKAFFGKDTITYELSENDEYTQSDSLHKELLDLISIGKINEAENTLFQKLDLRDKRQLILAIDFYQRLNKLDDQSLQKNNFSRQEIEDGLKEIAKRAGILTFDL